jgi:hypothetical protein
MTTRKGGNKDIYVPPFVSRTLTTEKLQTFSILTLDILTKQKHRQIKMNYKPITHARALQAMP